jgi:hypothetical protein
MNQSLGYIIVIIGLIILYKIIYKYIDRDKYCKTCKSKLQLQGFDDINRKLVCPKCYNKRSRKSWK